MALQMRYMEKLKGNCLSTYVYAWYATGGAGSNFSRIAEREDFHTAVANTASTSLSVTQTNYAASAHEYILRTILANTLLLSGEGRGNVKVGLTAGYSERNGHVQTVTASMYVVVTVYARNAAGVDRTLATVTTPTITQALNSTGEYGPASVTKTESIPFTVSFSEVKLFAYERLILSFVYYAKWVLTAGTHPEAVSCAAVAHHTMNSEEIFVELPIAGS